MPKSWNNKNDMAPFSTAEGKNQKMMEERSYFLALAEASLSGDYKKVQSMIDDYSHRHSISVYETITQFKDGRGRNILHFSCQSIVRDDVIIQGEDQSADEDDVVYQLLRSEWSTRHKIVQSDTGKDTKDSLLRCKDSDGISPLMVACQLAEKNPQLSYRRVLTLLQAGGNKLALARSKDGATCLHYAAGAGADEAMISVLYDAARAAIAVNSKGGGTPLHWAAGAKTNVIPTMKSLISYCHANIHAKSENGVTPLIVALASGNDDNATYLVENSDSDDRNVILPGKVTAYHIASDMNLPHALRALLLSYDEASYNTSQPLYNMKNERGESPLDLAVLSGNIQCVMMLLPRDHLGVNDEAVARLFMRQRNEELKDLKSENSVGEDKDMVYKRQEKYLEHEVSNESDKVKEIYSIEDRAKRDAEQFAKLSVTEEQKIDGIQHKMKGNELFSKRFFADAIHEYTLAIEADPADSAYYSNRSASYMSLKNYNEALYDAIICRSLKPDWAKGCYRLSAAQLALGKYEDAAVSAWEGVQLDNDNEELKCLLQKAVKLGNKEHKDKNAKIKGSVTLQTEDISSNI